MNDSYYSDIESDVLAEIRANDPVAQRFDLIYFISASKGKGRKRRHPVEVELVHDKYARRHTSWHLYQFDVVASEVLPGIPPDEVEAVLMERIRATSSF